MTDPAMEMRAGREGCRRHSGRIRYAPVGDHHQAAGETDPVAGAGYRAVVGQVFGDLFEPAPDEAVEWLQEEDGFTESVEELPGRIAAGQVGEVVREEALLMVEGGIESKQRQAETVLASSRPVTTSDVTTGLHEDRHDVELETHGAIFF